MATRHFLYMADMHVKARTWTNDMTLAGDSYEAIRRISTPLDVPVDTIVTGGDVFDSNRPSSTDIMNVFDFVGKFSNSLYIRGNHDSVSPPFLASAVPQQCDPETAMMLELDRSGFVDMGDYFITGLDWESSQEDFDQQLAELAKAVPGKKRSFIVIHAGVKELLGYDGTWQVSCERLVELFGDKPVTILAGHVHVRATKALTQTLVLHSPGSLYPCNAGETDRRHFVSLIDGKTGWITDIPVDVRLYSTVKFYGMKGVNEEACRLIGDTTTGAYPLSPLIRVEIDDPAEYDKSKFLFGENVLVKLVQDGDEELSFVVPKGEELSLDDAVSEELSDDRDLADMALSLVHSDDPVADIESWLVEWKVERIA